MFVRIMISSPSVTVIVGSVGMELGIAKHRVGGMYAATLASSKISIKE